LRDAPVARTKALDIWRDLDLAADDRPVAVDFINVSTTGVVLDGVPQRALVARLIRPLVEEHALLLKRHTPREAAEREIERLRTAIRDALNALGNIPCRRVAEVCPGCEVDIDDARAMLRRALDEPQPVWEQPPPLPAELTSRLDRIRARRAVRRAQDGTKNV
jgi:hypothetical protein